MDAAGPDQAVGWIIALACFFINFILAGLARSAGVLYVALIELYGASREAASTPFSIRVCVRNMSGPLIGLLGQKYGIRGVTTIGGFVAGLGGILCYFAPNITYITLFWGIVHGIGFGLSTVIHMMMINQYFDKYKASALGLGYSGDCFGSFAFPVIIESLLNIYDIKGTFLIIGGICLNVVPMAMLLKKPPWLKLSKGNFHRNISDEKNLSFVCDKSISKGTQNEGYTGSVEVLTASTDLKNSNENLSEMEASIPSSPFHNRVYRPSLSSYSSTRSCKQPMRKKATDILDRDDMERHNSLPPLFEKEAQRDMSSIKEREETSVASDIDQIGGSMRAKKRTTSNLSQLAYDVVNRVRTASFASQVAQEGYITFINQENHTSNAIDDQTIEDAKKPVDEDKPNVFRTLLRTNSKPIFILISMSMAVYGFLFVGIFTVIIDYATDYGISQDDGKYLIIGFSVTDLIGRLSFGQVIDRKMLEMKNYAGMTMVLMGASITVMPINRSFYFMLVCMCACGLIQGGTAIMFPILVSKYMKKDEESIAMGCLNFYGGLLMLPLSAMIGYFRDNTGSYDMVFYLQGSIVIIVGLIWQLEPFILGCANKPTLSKAANTV